MKIYGWEKNGKVYLSRSPREAQRPANEYANRQDAMREAGKRGLVIEWQE